MPSILLKSGKTLMSLHEGSLSLRDNHLTFLGSVFRVELVFAVRFELQQLQTTETERFWSHGDTYTRVQTTGSYTRVQSCISTHGATRCTGPVLPFKRSCFLSFGVVQVQTNCKQRVLRKKLTLGQSGSGPEGLRTSWTRVCTSARFQQIRGHERQI